MKTLLDIEKENAAIIEERTANIKELRRQLAEAQATAREIPGDHSLAATKNGVSCDVKSTALTATSKASKKQSTNLPELRNRIWMP